MADKNEDNEFRLEDLEDLTCAEFLDPLGELQSKKPAPKPQVSKRSTSKRKATLPNVSTDKQTTCSWKALKHYKTNKQHHLCNNPIISRDKDHIQIVKIIFCSKAKDSGEGRLQNLKHTKETCGKRKVAPDQLGSQVTILCPIFKPCTAGRLKKCISQWLTINSNQRILKVIRGVTIDFNEQPTQFLYSCSQYNYNPLGIIESTTHSTGEYISVNARSVLLTQLLFRVGVPFRVPFSSTKHSYWDPVFCSVFSQANLQMENWTLKC